MAPTDDDDLRPILALPAKPTGVVYVEGTNNLHDESLRQLLAKSDVGQVIYIGDRTGDVDVPIDVTGLTKQEQLSLMSLCYAHHPGKLRDVAMSEVFAKTYDAPKCVYCKSDAVKKMTGPGGRSSWVCAFHARKLGDRVTPLTAVARRAPNADCSCGSGKKFKRCCRLLEN
jgi:hypothetical protein